jgi:ABC-2 type transport system ATP-binding protein
MSRSIAIAFANLSKTFGSGSKQVHAVKQLNLEIEAGQVYGFLGHNGAGKTTSIRMILNLIHPTEGNVYLYGQHVRRERRVLQRVGALVEDARFYNFLSARDNLEVLARTGHTYDRARIEMLLEQVGVAKQAGQTVKGFSTGMKQRLGVAAALLSDPDLIILDEPTNGLDPAGIQEMRGFIRELVDKQGKTVFLSSHLLGEVEQICDRVAIIRKGQLVREGAVKDLLASSETLRIEASPLDRAARLLKKDWTVSKETDALSVTATREESPGLVRKLVENGIDVYQVSVQRQSLEAYFMSVTQEDAEDV